MKVLKNIILGLAVSLSVLFFGSCSGISKIKDIKVTSCGLESYSLKGLRSIDAVLAIGIDNPAMAFTVTDLSGILKYNGEDVAFYSADTVMVDKKSSKVYDLPCSATLSERVNLMQALQIARKGSLEGLTTDIEAKVKLKNGAGKTLRFKDLDLREMAERQ